MTYNHLVPAAVELILVVNIARDAVHVVRRADDCRNTCTHAVRSRRLAAIWHASGRALILRDKPVLEVARDVEYLTVVVGASVCGGRVVCKPIRWLVQSQHSQWSGAKEDDESGDLGVDHVRTCQQCLLEECVAVQTFL